MTELSEDVAFRQEQPSVFRIRLSFPGCITSALRVDTRCELGSLV